MSLRLLLVLPQLPQDAASGAARSLTTMAEMLAAHGFTVRALATSATEGRERIDAPALLASIGVRVETQRQKRLRPELHYARRSVSYRVIDVGPRSIGQWEMVVGAQFESMFDEELSRFQPDLMLTFGGTPGDVKRRQRAMRRGVGVVFGLRNEGYLNADRSFFDGMRVLTPSRFLTELYRKALEIDSTPLPSPIHTEDVIAAEREPIFVTMVNPSPEKGLMLFARVAEMIGTRRPDIPVLIVESRGSGGRLVRAGLDGGFDLRRHENLMFSPSVPTPAAIYAPAKMLLVPSVWRETFGRVAAEAMLNGVVPLVSNRGGLPETVEGCGFVIPVPEDVTVDAARPVTESVAAPWVNTIERLEDDARFYAIESAKARQTARRYLPEVLAPQYVEFFKSAAA